jgi:hypothetical protein
MSILDVLVIQNIPPCPQTPWRESSPRNHVTARDRGWDSEASGLLKQHTPPRSSDRMCAYIFVSYSSASEGLVWYDQADAMETQIAEKQCKRKYLYHGRENSKTVPFLISGRCHRLAAPSIPPSIYIPSWKKSACFPQAVLTSKCRDQSTRFLYLHSLISQFRVVLQLTFSHRQSWIDTRRPRVVGPRGAQIDTATSLGRSCICQRIMVPCRGLLLVESKHLETRKARWRRARRSPWAKATTCSMIW